MIRFDHFNFNVLDLDKSLQFYKDALDLVPQREKVAEDGSFKLVYIGNDHSDFVLELTWLRDRKDAYNLGDLEYHLALKTDKFDEYLARHKEMGCVCYENPGMGIYFVSDPDGYWIEIVPVR